MPSITDWLMVAITTVYVIATILICAANIRSAKATKEQIKESKRQFEENNRAFVTVSFEIIKSGVAVLHIQNIGKRIANDVNIRISDCFLNNMDNDSDREQLEKLCAASFTLGIGQSWYVCLGSHLDLKRIGNELLTIEISYADFELKRNEHVSIDLKQYFWSVIYESPTEDAYQEMRNQTKEIKNIREELRSISLNMHKEDKHV